MNVVDIQRLIDKTFNLWPAVGDLNHDGVVNLLDVQIVLNAALGLGCTSP